MESCILVGKHELFDIIWGENTFLIVAIMW